MSAFCNLVFPVIISLAQGGGTCQSNFHIVSSKSRKMLASCSSISNSVGPKKADIALSISMRLVHTRSEILDLLNEDRELDETESGASFRFIRSVQVSCTMFRFFPGANCVTNSAAPTWVMFLRPGLGSMVFDARSDGGGSSNRICSPDSATPNEDMKPLCGIDVVDGDQNMDCLACNGESDRLSGIVETFPGIRLAS